jgi:CDP-glucose 4,6-dehydratase
VENLAMTPSMWRNRRVLVTGHTGFKGGWLSLALAQMGCVVRGYATAAPTTPSFFEVTGLAGDMESVIGDIRDLDRLTSVMKDFAPEVVFHGAAQSLVRPSYEDPVGTYSANVMGSVNLLEAVRKIGGVNAVIMITSDKSYDNRERLQGYSESDPLGGFDPYSSSKGCAELVTAAYRTSYFSPQSYDRHRCAVASVRAGNVIGGGDWAQDRLVPDIIRAFMEHREPVIRNPNAVRPWQHVLECIEGYLTLAERLLTDGAHASEAWNFGPDDKLMRPVSWIADKMSQLWGDGISWQSNDDPRDLRHEAKLLSLDCSKAKERLGWRPKLVLDSALAWTVEWYRAFAGGADMRAFSLDQIIRFQDLSRI